MSTGQKVLVGCGITFLAIIAGVVLMIGGCVGFLVKGAKDFPAYARAENANPANKDITDRINQIISGATTPADAQSKIGAEKWPPKVIYIAFKSDEPNAALKAAYQPYTWNSNSTFVMNGNGYGSLGTPSGEKQIVIIEHSQDTSAGVTVNYVLYIEHLPEKSGP